MSAALSAAIADHGFLHLRGSAMMPLLGDGVAALPDFIASWERLETDNHMRDGGRYRQRRIANFWAEPGIPGHVRGEHRPHFQAVVHNTLNGGVDRWFAPMEDAIGANAALQAMLDLGRDLADSLAGAQRWFVEAHQFRIEAAPGAPGYPTPEGVHQDGVDLVVIAMLRRTNLAGGETLVETLDGKPLARFTLLDALDSAILDDRRVRHGVSPIEPVDAALPSARDVLVLTWKRR
ncbi:MAG: 2OG-Fe dioxygenase family protein [Pseudomonadota bacterium]